MPFHIFWIFGFISWLAVIAGVVLLIVWAMRARPPAAPGPPPHQAPPQVPARETPLEILARRFASGEIDADEYERARNLLGGGGSSGGKTG